MNHKINGQFIGHRVEMIRSPAFAALALSARRVLDRLEIECCKSAGRNNGNLICTHKDFRNFDIYRDGVGPGIRETEALGFIAVERGKAMGSSTAPSTYRLTYLPTKNAGPTDEWRNITTHEQARAIAAAARKTARPKKKAKPRRPVLVFTKPENGETEKS